MWKKPSALLFGVALIAFGCGGSDSRQNFVGAYNGNVVTTVTVAGASNTSTSPTTFTISNSSQGSNKIAMPQGGCNFTATVTNDTSFTVDPITCPPTPCGGTCTCVLSVTSGNGARSGSALTINASGTLVISGCGSATGTFTQVITANKV